jgi:DNA-binding beta-propeller fold protein YncE
MQSSGSKFPMAAALIATLGAGCAAAGTQTPPLASVDISGAAWPHAAPHPDRADSWMQPQAQACANDGVLPPCGLLYVSNYATDDVSVYQRDKLVGTLTGFQSPDGLCSDRTGNVWITNNQGASVVEYAHGKTVPISTLSDPGVYPLGCAVNPITGGLAVTNVASYGSGPGSVAIYHKAQGPPLVLSDPDIYFIYFCAYDPAGNLYVDGLNTSGAFQFAVLPRNKVKFKAIVLDKTVYFPGDVFWDGHHIVVGDQRYQNENASALYRTNGEGGSVLQTTVLDDATDAIGYWAHSNGVIAADLARNAVDLYHYPQGGAPELHVPHFHNPYGLTVSVVH